MGQDRDQYITQLVGDVGIKGSYGGFSATLKFQFDMTEDTTEAYSFGTRTKRWLLYSLKAPAGLHYSNKLLNQQFVNDLCDEKMSPEEFYHKWGTHFTSDIIIGGSASLSLYSQYKKTYDKRKFSADLSAAYDSIALKWQTEGTFHYNSKSSEESYRSSSALVLQGGDPTAAKRGAGGEESKMVKWLKTVVDAPAFLNFNQDNPTYHGLTPMYALLSPHEDRRQKLEKGLEDYLYPPLHLRIFAAASTLTEFPAATVRVPEGYKILSGGAQVTSDGPGELLTASFPISTSQWTARARDCVKVDEGILTVFAIGVYDPYSWLDVTIRQSQSEPSQRPTALVDLDASYAMTGGGADCEHDSSGNQIYLTASYPYSKQDPRDASFSSNTWQVAGKDAFVAANARIKAYAVGVKWSNEVGGQPPITTECLALDSSYAQHPKASLGPPDQTALVGGGAYDRFTTGQGNMLIDSYPQDLSKWHAAGKGHIEPSSATLTVYAIGVKIGPQRICRCPHQESARRNTDRRFS